MSPSVVRTLGPAGFGSYEVEWKAQGPILRPTSSPAEITLCPGFVDTHIHGAFGIDLMGADAAGMIRLADRLEEIGVEAFLPTTVTASAEDIRAFLTRLPVHRGIAGVHLEGPFISPDYPGAQPREAIADAEKWRGWENILTDPRVRLVSLAPELAGAGELIDFLVGRGVGVSMGHSAATAQQAEAAFAKGADRVTHAFNAMRPLHHREPGLIGFALTEPRLWCELIYDRLHVCRRAAEILIRCKGPDLVVAVSDGTMAAGMPDGSTVEMWGHRCRVENGAVRLESGALAGSAITMLDAFRNLAEDFGPEVAIRACAITPRSLLPELSSPRVCLEFDPRMELVGLRRLSPES